MNIEKNKEDVNVPTPSPEPQMEDPTSNKEISQRPEEQVARDDSSCVSSDEEEDDLQQTPAGSDGTSPYGQILEHLTGKARRNFKRKMRRKRLELHMKALKSENASADPTPVSWGPRGGPPGSTIYINRPRSTKGPMNAWVSKKPSGDPAPVSWGPRGGPPGSTIYINRPRYTRGSMNAWVSKKPSGDSGPVSWGPRGGPPGSTIYINRPRYTPASSYTRGPMKRQADRVARKQPIVLPTEPASRREESVPSGRCVQDEPDSTRRSPDPARPSVRTSGTRQYRTPSPVEEEPTSSKWRRLGSPTLPKARSIQDKTDYAERPSVLGTIRPPSVSTRDTRRYRTSSPEEEEPASFEWRRRRSPTHPELRWDQDKTDYADRSPDTSRSSVPGTVRQSSASTRGTRQYRTPSPEVEEPMRCGWTSCGSVTHPEARWDQDKTDYAEKSPDTARPSVPGTVRQPSVSTRGTSRYRTPSPVEEPMRSAWTRFGSPTLSKARWDQDKADYAERSPDTSRPSVPGTVRQPSVSTRGTRRYRTPSPEEEKPMRSGWTSCGSVTHPEARWDQDKTDYAERPSVLGTIRPPSVSTRGTRLYRTPSPVEEEPMRSGWTRCGSPTHPKVRWDQDQTDYARRSPDTSRTNVPVHMREPFVSARGTKRYRTPSPEEEEPASSGWTRCGNPTHPKARCAQDKTDYAERSPDTSRCSVPVDVREPSVSTKGTRRYSTPSPEEEEPASSEWRRRRSSTHPEARWDQDKTDYAERSPDPQPYGSRSSETAVTRQPSVSTKRTSHYRTPSPEEVNDDYPTYAGVFPISKQSAPSISQPTPGQTKLHVVIRSDRPSGLVLPDEAERIRAYVVEESLRAMEEDGVPVLRFLNSGRIDIGWFLVIAYDVGTCDWLLTRLPPLAIGEQVFWPVRVADAPWPVRVGFRVRTEGPLCQERLERMLRLQNPTFNVREWMFLGAADEGTEGECLVTFLISQEETTLLEQAGWTLFYELGAVTVQRLTVHGRDAVQYPSGADGRST